MDGPGMSLFNGAGSIHLNTSLGRMEEEEALEEERLRKEELHNELNKHFDDFEDDEEETMDDSAHYTSINTTRSRKNNLGGRQPPSLHDELLQPVKRNSGGNIHIPGEQGNGGKAGFHHKHNGCHPGAEKNAHHQHCYQMPTGGHYENSHQPPGLNVEFQSTRQSDEQLQFILEMKCREVQKLSEELAKCRKEASNAHDELYGRLAVAEAERERAQLSLQQSKELVENSKHRVTDLEHEVTSLKKKVAVLTMRNEELSAEVTAVTASLMDTQSRLQVAQLNKESAHNTDALFKALHERHNEDTERLEKDLMKTRKRLQDKENEYSSQEKRYQDLEHSKETLLIDKGSTINQLAMELKETQDRLAEMGERSSQLISERNTARLQSKDLAHKFEDTAKELVEYRTKCIRLQEEQSELDQVLAKLGDCEETNSFVQLHADQPVRGFSAHADKVEMLRTELTKRIMASKLKEEQIDKLNRAIQQKDHLLEQRKENEDKLRVELEMLRAKELKVGAELKQLTLKMDSSKSNMDAVNTFRNKCSELETELKQTKTDFNSLLTKYTSLELKYEELNSEYNDKNSQDSLSNKDLLKEKEKLNYQLKDAQKQVEEFKNLYVEISGERDKLVKEINEFKSSDIYQDLKIERTELENHRNLLDAEKKKVDKLQKALLDLQKNEFDIHLQNFKKSMDNKTSSETRGNVNAKHLEEIDMLKTESDCLQRMCEEQEKRLKDLTRELEESKNIITKLKIENELQGERDRLIADLKEKGKQFEKYIENQKMRLMNRKDVGTSTEEKINVANAVSEIIQTSLPLDDNKNQVNPKVEEAIRDEIARQFAMEINRLENQFRNKVSAMEEEYVTNITKLGDALKIKTREITSLQHVIVSERSRFKDFMTKMNECQQVNENNEKVLAEYKTNLEKYKQHIVRLNNEINDLNKQKTSSNKDSHKGTIEELNKIKDKYKTLKKCALKYKEYNAEKDKHVEKELEKIKSAYECKLKKMQAKLQEYLKDAEFKIHNSNSMENIVNNNKNTQRREVS